MKSHKIFVLALAMSVMMGAASASAQVLVGFQQRFFEKYGDGSGVGSPDVIPCCDITLMNPTPTFDARTAGPAGGPYFAEYKNKTAMVGNLYGFGTPAALNGDGPAWYGNYNTGTGGVTLKQGRYTTMASLMLVFPGGNLRRLTTMLDRTVLDLVMRPGNGPGAFTYFGAGHTPGQPTFRTSTDWTPYPAMAGQIIVTPGPNQFGGARAIIHNQFASGVNNGSIPGFANRFRAPVKNGPGVPFTSQNIVRRETASGSFVQVTIPSTMATTGMEVFAGLGTAWFTLIPYTTGTVNVIAATIGTPINNYQFRTDMGFNSLMQTAMGGVTGTLQLVSGHLLQSRQAINTNGAGTNLTRVVFTPEPGSAAMLGAGVLGLIGLVLRDRRSDRI